ncbi:DMT family transporter [Acidimangrovimonas sediminis]|uniref:DMT family transporter n=1 Tax=Acidimangrovimonas sediminis TaxID=2056283 RepID=UPI000C7FF7A8|nr:DMT family transporter [Acidimangrovimonas sediminis]
MTLSDRAKGRTLVICSALTFSSAGIFTQGVSAGPWDIVFWRGITAASFTLAYLGLTGRLRAEWPRFGWSALAAAVIGASGTAAFIPSFKLTDVASVTMIYGTCPFVTAALGWLWLRERPSPRVLFASLVALAGVLMAVSDTGHLALRPNALRGDLLAFGMTLAMAILMLIYRRWPETPAGLPAALSSVLLLPLAATFGQIGNVSGGELIILSLFGLVFAVASVTLSLGARRLPGVETALLSTLELPFAPLLAFLILAETPPPRTLFGGLVVLMAVFYSLLERPQSEAELLE